MNTLSSSGIAPRACGLGTFWVAITALALVGKPATDACPSAPAATADQVQPERRIRRLGQLYGEIQELLAEHRTAVNRLKDIERAQNKATAVQKAARAVRAEDLLQQRIAAAQHSLAELQPQWAAANQRVTQLFQAIQSDLPKNVFGKVLRNQ